MLINNQIPHIFFIPSMVWKTPNKLFSDRNYEGKNSLPDWGINLSMKNLPLLAEYDISSFINWINRI
jgi:hypothetical protein